MTKLLPKANDKKVYLIFFVNLPSKRKSLELDIIEQEKLNNIILINSFSNLKILKLEATNIFLLNILIY